MATADEYAAWIVKNAAKKGMPEFDTVAQAYELAKGDSGSQPEKSFPEKLGQQVWNAYGGVARGAGSIGASILRAIPHNAGIPDESAAPMGIQGPMYQRAMNYAPKRDTAAENDQRRQSMTDALGGFGADTDSLAFGGGKLAAEIAGTSGLGGVLAKGAALAPGVARIAPNLLEAIRTAGMSSGATGAVGNALTRAAGGAITGAASAGAVNPSDALTGAAVGAVAPGAIQLAGKAGGATGRAVWDMFTPEIQKKAMQLAQMTGKPIDEVVSALGQRGRPIPGSERTVPQILQDPNISQAARTLQNQGQFGLVNREAENNLARIAALERVAPTAGTVNEARANAGNALASFAKRGEAAASGRVSQLFNAIPKNDAQINMPFANMQAAIDKYLGKGSFGEGEGAVNTAMSKAKQIGTETVPGAQLEYSTSDLARGGTGLAPSVTQSKPVPFDELQHLRSSIGEAAQKAKRSGDLQASAALKQMKASIDNQIGAAVGGDASAGSFTPQAADIYGQALNAHRAKKLQFNTGPQAAIFRTGADGLPAKEGAEVTPMFWNSGNAQIENMQAFKRLSAGDQNLARLMKSNATTELLDQAKGAKGPNNPDGTLTAAAVDKWMRNHAGAAKELFTQPELAVLKAIQNETGAAAAAENLARATGSNTAQNLFSMGALGSNKLAALANNTPGVKYVAGPLLDWMKSGVQKNRNEILARLLAEPQEMAQALQLSGLRTEQGRNLADLLRTSPQVQQMLLRGAPVAAISGQ